MSSSSTAFPIGTHVVLNWLVSTESNGKCGIVQGFGPERYHVRLTDGSSVAIREVNLTLGPRNVESLSVKELKFILKEIDGKQKVAGMDRKQLQTVVAELGTPDRNAEILLRQKQALSLAASSQVSLDKDQILSSAEQMSKMDPEQLQRQAAALRMLPPDQLRRQNPMLAHLSDEQIRLAAVQFERMASNPDAMKIAAEQMKGMTPEELERQTQAMYNVAPTSNRSVQSETNTNSTNMLESMDPERIKQQAAMLKSMPPEQLRMLHPQFANMSDEQIQQTSAQMEMLASNPAMLKMAAQAMQNMSPEDIKAVQEGRVPNNSSFGSSSNNNTTPSSTMDMSSLFKNMTGKQVKNMIRTMKENPDLLRSMVPDGTDSKYMERMMEQLNGMDETTLERILMLLTGFWNMVQPLVRFYQRCNQLLQGQLPKLILFLVAASIAILIYKYILVRSGSSSSTINSVLLTDEEDIARDRGMTIDNNIDLDDEF